MWIPKNTKELLEHLKSPTFNHVTSIKSFDFSTLYTIIHHQKLKKTDSLVLYETPSISKTVTVDTNIWHKSHEETYFVKEDSDSKNKYSEDDTKKMLEFPVDNMFVAFAKKVFQQTVGIQMGANCTPLLAIFLYSYEAEFIVFALNGKETVSISVQSHLQVHR